MPAYRYLVLLILTLFGTAAGAQSVQLRAELSHPVLPAGQTQTLYAKISLSGVAQPRERPRPPVNLALVLDRSGSMSGQKIEQAREAAVTALDYLDSRDILAVVAYDSVVDVLVPATKVSDKTRLAEIIRRLDARDSTALYAGVSQGAAEVRKFLEPATVNRIILLSDGLANVGPDSPAELGKLGAQLGEAGIAVTTLGLGLGYNEDLMSQLARRSDGNHAFIENATDLSRVFALEFGDVLSVVAQDVELELECGSGVRPLRVLGREAEISGNRVKIRLNQLNADQEKYLLLELSAPAGADGKQRELLQARVNYLDLGTQAKAHLEISAQVRFDASAQAVESAVDKDVMVAATEQVAVEKNKQALELRDQGKVEEAEAALKQNADYLSEQAGKYDSERLQEQSKANAEAASNLAAPEDWARQRKLMRKDQHSIETQQAY